jgi:hypothetical protein
MAERISIMIFDDLHEEKDKTSFFLLTPFYRLNQPTLYQPETVIIIDIPPGGGTFVNGIHRAKNLSK